MQDNFDDECSRTSSREGSAQNQSEDYVAQVSQDISRILGALSKLDQFLFNPSNRNTKYLSHG